MSAVRYDALPGPITGMSSTERSAFTPESLIVSMHTASYPSSSAVSPASKRDEVGQDVVVPAVEERGAGLHRPR